MKSPVVKRSLTLHGHKTSISLEEPFWTAIREIAALRGTPFSAVVSGIDKTRTHGNLSSAVRLHVLEYYREVAAGGLWPRRHNSVGRDNRRSALFIACGDYCKVGTGRVLEASLYRHHARHGPSGTSGARTTVLVARGGRPLLPASAGVCRYPRRCRNPQCCMYQFVIRHLGDPPVANG